MDFLRLEYSKYNPGNKIWKNGLFSATIVLLIFILFQPFGFSDKDIQLKIFLFPGYALFGYMHSYLTYHIIRQILTKKKTWTITNELISFLISMILLTFVVHLFTHFVTGDMSLSFKWYFKLLYHVSSLFLVIGIMEFFYYNNRAAKINNRMLSSQFEKAKLKLDNAQKQNVDTLSLSLEKEPIEINRNKLLYIQSMSNYLEFNLCEANGKISKITKRGRLHKVEKDIAPFSEFFRCHRAFIINLKKKVQLKGNMKNARVIFESVNEEIPVSRTFYKSLKEQIEKITLN